METRLHLGWVRQLLVAALVGAVVWSGPALAQPPAPRLKSIIPNVPSWISMERLRLDGGGTTIVGVVNVVGGGSRVVAWDEAGNPGLTGSVIPGNVLSFSDNGEVVAWRDIQVGGLERVKIRKPDGTDTDIGVLSGYEDTLAPVVSGDGQVVFAFCRRVISQGPPVEVEDSPVMWTSPDGLVLRPTPGGGPVQLSSRTGRRVTGVSTINQAGMQYVLITNPLGGTSSFFLSQDVFVVRCMTPSGRFLGGWERFAIDPPHYAPALWNSIGAIELLPRPTSAAWFAAVTAVAAEGDLAIVVDQYQSYIWKRGDGYLGETTAYLQSRGVNTAGWSNLVALDISDDGQTILGSGTRQDPLGTLSLHWIIRFGSGGSSSSPGDGDSDLDGLMDDWEINGVPYHDGEGQFYRYPLPGANPLRKDIYVEIDAMEGQAPIGNALARVVAAFDQAPVPAVPGLAGGLPGVTLHCQLDQTLLALVSWENADFSGHSSFYPTKNTYFGTISERFDLPAGWPAVRAAKAQAYRYGIFAWKLPRGILGYGENDDSQTPARGGDDFWLGLNGDQANEDSHAATFMHELGHNLGLRHGGGDDQHCKPNYYSVMNYAWALPGQLGLAGGAALNLDYSRSTLDALDERMLNESAGVGHTSPTPRFPFIVRTSSAPALICNVEPLPFTTGGECQGDHSAHVPHTCMNYGPLSGGVDWNNDGIISPGTSLVCADINQFKMEAETGLTILPGHNDWPTLRYNHRLSDAFNPNAFYRGGECITYGQVAYFRSLPAPVVPCPAPPPVLATPSIDPPSLCVGSDLVLSVEHPGTGPLKAQWEIQQIGADPEWIELDDGTMDYGTQINGAYALTLSMTSVNTYDFNSHSSPFARFRLRAEDQCGQVAYSPEVSLRVLPSLTNTTPLVAAACPGGSVVLSVIAEGVGPFTYEWRWHAGECSGTFVDETMSAGTVVSGSGSPTLTLSSLSQADFCGDNPSSGSSGNPYLTCTVYDACGAGWQAKSIDVNIGGPAFASSPTTIDLSCAGGGDGVFAVQAVGDAPLTYRWQRNGVDVQDGGPISGADTATLTISNVFPTDAALFTCAVSNGCGTSVTYPAALNVGPPQVAVQPTPIVACAGPDGYGVTSVTAVGTQPLAYQWMRNGVDLVDGPAIGGAQSPELTVGNQPGGGPGVYACRMTNSCGTAVSQGVTAEFVNLTVSVPASVSVCRGGTVTLEVAPNYAGSVGGFIYNWEVRNPDLTWEPLPYNFFFPYGACGGISGIDSRQPTLDVTWMGGPGCPASLLFRCIVRDDCTQVTTAPIQLIPCLGDFNCSATVSVQDIFDFLAAYFVNDPRADINTSGSITVQDIFDFLSVYFGGCN